MKKIYLPESIERILERIEDIYNLELQNLSFFKNESDHTKVDAVKFQLEQFKEFKTSLENGTNILLLCEEGKEDESKVLLMHSIEKLYNHMSADNICRINNDVYIQTELQQRLKKLNRCKLLKTECKNILNFMHTAYNSSWGQSDAYYKVKDFRLVESEEAFEEIISKFHDAEELTNHTLLISNFTTIRIAFVPMNFSTIYKKKGIWEDYQKFWKEHLSDNNLDTAIKMFNLWHDIRETAIYYIYVPENN